MNFPLIAFISILKKPLPKALAYFLFSRLPDVNKEEKKPKSIDIKKTPTSKQQFLANYKISQSVDGQNGHIPVKATHYKKLKEK
ncbi:hypothetical protein IQ229_01145 [Nostoc cf. edaphicum LEGE 07299]|uniref:Uncharacterized protein n=1 Tax=Nostoc cf. edaphicum LEGE 07299 TaxID=2777974 RepID=A0ABR9TT78_9NOSO|nr:hypothetical protein [Nostoc edaphicum]MBE9103598.1 hypothetical protein [Nostoc cf. edaphicum LEGE 07299]